MRNIHLVTGGTGVVGTCVVLELLRQTDSHIICVVRPDSDSATTRLHKALENAADIYGYPDNIFQDIKERCQAVPGDVRSKLCGISRLPNLSVSQFWHSAALLQYEDRYKANIFATNVQGTHNALELARHVGASCFNHVSTAYVAGVRSGLILEQPVHDHRANNLYEASKIEAEANVSRCTDLQVRIFRPSIVIGHSSTYAITSFTGLYGLIHKLYQFKSMLSRFHVNLPPTYSVKVRADPNALLNFIPVDILAHQMVRISNSRSSASIFHLTNSTCPTVAEVASPLFQEMGMREPLFVDTTDAFDEIDKKFEKMLVFYGSYFQNSKIFDRSHSNKALENNAAGEYVLDTNRLLAYYHWYISHQKTRN